MITYNPFSFAFLIASIAAIPLSTVMISPSEISSIIFSYNPYPSEKRCGIRVEGFKPYIRNALTMITVALMPSTS